MNTNSLYILGDCLLVCVCLLELDAIYSFFIFSVCSTITHSLQEPCKSLWNTSSVQQDEYLIHWVTFSITFYCFFFLHYILLSYEEKWAHERYQMDRCDTGISNHMEKG